MDGSAVPGSLSHYVSISREENTKGSNIKLSCSAHFTGAMEMRPDIMEEELLRAQARSMKVAVLAYHSINTLIERGVSSDEIEAFIERVNAVSGQMASGGRFA